MARKSPSNPNKITPSRLRVCDGIGGKQLRVLKRIDARGHNISNTVVNDLIDFDLTERGSLIKRDGSRKMNDTGKSYSMDSLFPVNLGREMRYGIILNGALNVIDIPMWTVPAQSPFDFEPPEAVTPVATKYPLVYTGDPQ